MRIEGGHGELMILTAGDVRWHRYQCRNEGLYGDNCVEEKGPWRVGTKKLHKRFYNNFAFLEKPA
jgi:hypothetical protein